MAGSFAGSLPCALVQGAHLSSLPITGRSVRPDSYGRNAASTACAGRSLSHGFHSWFHLLRVTVTPHTVKLFYVCFLRRSKEPTPKPEAAETSSPKIAPLCCASELFVFNLPRCARAGHWRQARKTSGQGHSSAQFHMWW